MERPRKYVIYLDTDDLISFNENLIFHSGGKFIISDHNILNNGSLDHLVYYVKAIIFGKKVCRTRYDIASAYSFFIIKDHIFHDGCKRTGILAAQVFLERNRTRIHSTNNELKRLAFDIEANRMDRRMIARWYKDHKI